MSRLENEVLQKFHEALAADHATPKKLTEDVVAELSATTGPNSERLANLFRQAAGGVSK